MFSLKDIVAMSLPRLEDSAVIIVFALLLTLPEFLTGFTKPTPSPAIVRTVITATSCDIEWTDGHVDACLVLK